MVVTSSSPVVTASGLTKAYGPEAGVFDMDIDIQPGTIVGFIGPSGSGKTTTVHLFTGVLRPDSGAVEVLGQRPSRFTKSTRARFGYLAQQPILYPDLTLWENLRFAASLYGVPKGRAPLTRLVDFMELGDAIRRLPREASGGEKKRLMLASTMVHDPDLLFLDEPTAGIDPVLRRKFWDRFEELAADGRTLVVTTQYVGEAAYCDYVAVLAGGRVLTIDTPDGLRRAAYGGDIVEVDFAEQPGFEDVADLKSTYGSVDWVHGRRLRVVVDDHEAATASIPNWFRDRGVEVTRTDTYMPPFDDVFVELVSKLDPEHAEGSDSG